ncbi:transcription factor TFIIIB component B [Ceratobasidium sp. AG-Ba]|nr:transcription factor TFIIIB component B [Ceratobasidium sp. AG-Ba]QRW11800.1 transcription factor TFIIIB component B [Ceratobasidium sp. AG-Ba]
MAGGHASSRVDSGSMKFRPVGASSRRPASSTPSRPGPSGSVASTPSRHTNRLNQTNQSHSGMTSGSDTDDGPAASGQRPRSAIPRSTHSVRIAPGISRTPSSHNSQKLISMSPSATRLSGSGSLRAAPQSQSSPMPSSSSGTGASSIDTLQGAASRNALVKPVPRPVFVPSPIRSATSVSLPNQILPIAPTEATLLFPPATQVTPSANEYTAGSSTPRNFRPIQIGQTRYVPEVSLPTPPSSQTTLPFPLDPSLGGPSVELIFPIPENEVLSASELFPVVAEPTFVHGPENFQAPPVAIRGPDPMPPPPPIPPAGESPDSNAPPEVNPSTGEISASPKKRRARRTRTDSEDQSKKKRKWSQVESNDQTDDEETADKPKRKRGRKASVGTRKAITLEDRISALEKQAAEAEEQGALNEPLDPTNATMASLCEADLPTGRLSSKFLEKGIAYVKHVEERRKRIMERTAERLKVLRSSGLDPEDPRQPAPVKKPEATPASESISNNLTAGPSTSNLMRELGASLSPSPEPETEPAEKFAESAAAPQIRFVNGEMVLDEESQFYDRTAAAQAGQDEDSMVIVDEADSTRFSNSASFAKREGARGSRWTADETELFYWCLSAFGEDYENIARYLGRTPGQCKNKTKAEDRKGNEQRITMAIKTRVPLDLEEFGRITGRDFSGPPPEIRAPTVPPSTEEQQKEQEPVMVGPKAKTPNSAPNTPRKRGKAPARDEEEEIMTLEEYERDNKDD